MKLISLNIQNNLHGENVLKFLKKENAEVVCFQECLEENFDFFKKELGFEGVFKTLSYVDSAAYPDLKDKKQGVAILTKKILDSGYIFYAGSEENTPRPFTEYKPDEKFNANSNRCAIQLNKTTGKNNSKVNSNYAIIFSSKLAKMLGISTTDELTGPMPYYFGLI